MGESDKQLVSEFCKARTEQAFASLVERHINLVFATAARLVGDHHIAEEITQNVFVALAQSAGKLGHHPTLAGWLYQTTVNKSRERLRSELRRTAREKIAAQLESVQTAGESVWSPLMPLLDEGLLQLREPDRLAVVLHFLEGQSFREVGAALGIGEDAARKRVDRCLEQLTLFFRRHGFAVQALAVGTPLFTISSPAAPAGLAAAVSAASLASSAGSTLTCSAIEIMAATKLKITVAALVVAGVSTPLVLQHRSIVALRHQNVLLKQQFASATLSRAESSQLMPVPRKPEPAEGASANSPSERPAAREQAGSAVEQTNRLAALRRENEHLRTTLSAIQREDEANRDFVKINKANLQGLRFEPLSDRFGLTSQAADLLEVTPDESERLKGVLNSLKERIQAHDIQHLRTVPPAELKDPDIARFLDGKEGERTVFRIPPHTNQDKLAAQDWLFQSISDVLGEQRKDLFAQNARYALDFWFGGTEDKIIAFVDRADAEGAPIEHDWMVKFNTPSRQGTYSGTGSQPVPGLLEYLFEAVQKTSNR